MGSKCLLTTGGATMLTSPCFPVRVDHVRLSLKIVTVSHLQGPMCGVFRGLLLAILAAHVSCFVGSGQALRWEGRHQHVQRAERTASRMKTFDILQWSAQSSRLSLYRQGPCLFRQSIMTRSLNSLNGLAGDEQTILYRDGTADDGPSLVDLSLEAFDSGGIVSNALTSIQHAFQGTTLRSEVEGGLSRRMLMLNVDGDEEQGDAQEKYALYVAEDRSSGQMVGMVELGILPCPVPLRRRPAPEIPYLVNLAVSRDYRRQGIARALIAECERIAADEWGYTEMFLHVKSNNRPARALYASLGYVCEFQEPMWYRLKSGQQKLRTNPRLFLRKVFAAQRRVGSEEEGQEGVGGGRKVYVWGNDP